MKLIALYRKNVSTSYQNTLCSYSTIVVAIIFFVCLGGPIWLIDKINNPLKTEKLLFERPDVQFNYDFLVLLERQTKNGQPILGCSSFEEFNKVAGHLPGCSMIKFSELYETCAEKTDMMNFQFTFDTVGNLTGSHLLSVYIFLKFKLTSVCIFDVPGGINFYQKPLPLKLNGGTVRIEGNLRFRQKSALQCPFFMLDRKSQFSASIGAFNTNSIDDFRFTKYGTDSYANESHFYFEQTKIELRRDEVKHFPLVVEIAVNITDESVRYEKTFWQLLAQFWMKYLSIFFCFSLLARKLLDFLFSNNYLRAAKERNLYK